MPVYCFIDCMHVVYAVMLWYGKLHCKAADWPPALKGTFLSYLLMESVTYFRLFWGRGEERYESGVEVQKVLEK